jgi:hypothetical protein
MKWVFSSSSVNDGSAISASFSALRRDRSSPEIPAVLASRKAACWTLSGKPVEQDADLPRRQQIPYARCLGRVRVAQQKVRWHMTDPLEVDWTAWL